MNLIVDLGNTAVKVALFDQGVIVTKEKFSTKKSHEDLNHWLTENAKKFSATIISSVVNSTDLIELIDSSTLLELTEKTNLPFKNSYNTPETLGKDRLANAAAMWALNKSKNSLSIDFGTCIKYDLITSKGEYIGGAISPGIRMRFKALNTFTDKLPLLDTPQNFNLIGKETKSSLNTGVMYGVINEIIGFINRYTELYNDLTIFMTGGELINFDIETKNPIFVQPDLTLIGLNEILEHNLHKN